MRFEFLSRRWGGGGIREFGRVSKWCGACGSVELIGDDSGWYWRSIVNLMIVCWSVKGSGNHRMLL